MKRVSRTRVSSDEKDPWAGGVEATSHHSRYHSNPTQSSGEQKGFQKSEELAIMLKGMIPEKIVELFKKAGYFKVNKSFTGALQPKRSSHSGSIDSHITSYISDYGLEKFIDICFKYLSSEELNTFFSLVKKTKTRRSRFRSASHERRPPHRYDTDQTKPNTAKTPE